MKNFVIELKETFRQDMHDIVMGSLFLFWPYLLCTINSSIKLKYIIGIPVFGVIILFCTWMRTEKGNDKNCEKNIFSLKDITVPCFLCNMELEIIIDKIEKFQEKIVKIQLNISTLSLFMMGLIGIVSNIIQISLYAVCLGFLLSIYSLKAKDITEVFLPGVILLMYWIYVCIIINNTEELSVIVNVFSFLCGIILSIISIKQNRMQTAKK